MVQLTCTVVHTNFQLCYEKNTTVAMEICRVHGRTLASKGRDQIMEHGWKFLLSGLWFCFVVFRASRVREYDLDSNPDLLFAPRQLLVRFPTVFVPGEEILTSVLGLVRLVNHALLCQTVTG